MRELIIALGLFFFIEGIHLEYKTHKTATYLWQFTGVTMLPLLLFGIYIFFREGGINGTWIYFNLLFISSLFQFILEHLIVKIQLRSSVLV